MPEALSVTTRGTRNFQTVRPTEMSYCNIHQPTNMSDSSTNTCTQICKERKPQLRSESHSPEPDQHILHPSSGSLGDMTHSFWHSDSYVLDPCRRILQRMIRMGEYLLCKQTTTLLSICCHFSYLSNLHLYWVSKIYKLHIKVIYGQIIPN